MPPLGGLLTTGGLTIGIISLIVGIIIIIWPKIIAYIIGAYLVVIGIIAIVTVLRWVALGGGESKYADFKGFPYQYVSTDAFS